MSHERPSDAGFCVVDGNADLIADALVRRLRETAAEMESLTNRLYRGRNGFDLNAVARRDLAKTVRRLGYVAETLRDVELAQRSGVAFLQAAE